MLLSLQGHLHPVAWFIITIIVFIFISAFMINLLIRKKYAKIQQDLDDRVQRRNEQYESNVLNIIIEDYKSASMGNYSEVNTQAIIEKSFNQELRTLNMGERYVKHATSLMIVLGLLGTFFGLTLAVGEIVQTLAGSAASEIMDNFTPFVEGLLSAVLGMAVAFITSLVGISCSVMLTVLNIVFDVEEARETLMVHVEEYLDNTVALVLSKDKQTEYSMMNNILRNTFVEFGEKIEKTLQRTVDKFGDKLSHVVMEVEVSSKALDGTVEKFDASLKNFAGNIRDFSEFNFNLRNNIERMDVSFIKVAEAIQSTSKIIEHNYEEIENFSRNMKEASGEMTIYNKQVIKSMSNLVAEVQASVSSMQELSGILHQDMNARMEYVQKYEQSLSALIIKIEQEIKSMGLQTLKVFGDSLEQSGKITTQNISGQINGVCDEMIKVVDTLKDHQKIFAKTIAMLPDQMLAYQEAAAAKMDKQLAQIKEK